MLIVNGEGAGLSLVSITDCLFGVGSSKEQNRDFSFAVGVGMP